MKKCLLILTLLIVVGCGQNEMPKSSSTPMLEEIQKITAEILHESPNTLNPDSTFAALGADDLDLVEITMEVEEKMDIIISDDALCKEVGTSLVEDLVQKLTLRGFANVASASMKKRLNTSAEDQKVTNGDLRESQVGLYGELSKKPNPNGHVLVFISNREFLMQQSEQKLGRIMTQDEQDALKEKAVVIALPPAISKEIKQKQTECELVKEK